jgi:hypothetical protein
VATQDKIEIQLSSGSGFYFKAIQYKPNLLRAGSIEQTFSGLDVTIAPTIKSFQYVVRVPIDETSGSEGNYDDLYGIIELCNPEGVPSASFIFTDHFGDIYNVAWIKPGSTSNIQPLTTQLEGVNAYMMVPIEVLCQNWEFPDHTDFSDPEMSYIASMYF